MLVMSGILFPINYRPLADISTMKCVFFPLADAHDILGTLEGPQNHFTVLLQALEDIFT